MGSMPRGSPRRYEDRQRQSLCGDAESAYALDAMKRFPCPYERRRGNRNHSHPPADAAPLGIAPQTRGRPATTTAVEGHSLPFLHPSISSGAPSWKELANLLLVTWGFTLHKLRVHCASPDCTTQAVRRSTDTVDAMCVVGMHLDRHGRVSATKPGMRKADEIASKVKSNRVQRRFTALVEQPWPQSGCADQMPAMKGRMPFPSWRAYNMHNCQSADERHPPKPTSFFVLGRRRPLKSTLPAGRGYRLRMDRMSLQHAAQRQIPPCAHPEGICRDDMRRTRLQQRSNVQPRTPKVQHVAYSKQVRHTPCCAPRRLRSDFWA